MHFGPSSWSSANNEHKYIIIDVHSAVAGKRRRFLNQRWWKSLNNILSTKDTFSLSQIVQLTLILSSLPQFHSQR